MLPRFALPTLAPAIVLLAAAPAGAQSAALLPSAPEPHTILAASPAAALSNPDKPSQPSPQPPRQPVVEPSDPMLTLFPHREDAQWWLSGQANIIFQGRLPFHSPYQGPHSFRNSAEYKTSEVGTFYSAWRPTHSVRYNTDLIFDLETALGRGLSEALGLAGETNIDVVRNPYLSINPYPARYQIHQVIGLTDQIRLPGS
ncbi:MAG: hypothetical protein WBX09_11245 [Terracidiphilus sp.]